MLKLKLQYFGHLMRRTDSLEKTLMLIAAEGGIRGWDGWMASPTRWTWVWVSSRSWWWTGKPGVLQSMGWQRVGHNWATALNWTEWNFSFLKPLKVINRKVLYYMKQMCLFQDAISVSFTFSLLVLCIQYDKENSVVAPCFITKIPSNSGSSEFWKFPQKHLFSGYIMQFFFWHCLLWAKYNLWIFLINFSHGLIAEFLDRLMNF